MGQKFEFLTISSLYIPYISATAKIEAYKQRMKLFDPPCRNTEICPPPRGKAVWNANGGFVSVLLMHLFYFILFYIFCIFISLSNLSGRFYHRVILCIALTTLSQDVRPSVCLSHAGIVSKRLNVSSNFSTVGSLHHSSFSTPNVMAIF